MGRNDMGYYLRCMTWSCAHNSNSIYIEVAVNILHHQSNTMAHEHHQRQPECYRRTRNGMRSLNSKTDSFQFHDFSNAAHHSLRSCHFLGELNEQWWANEGICGRATEGKAHRHWETKQFYNQSSARTSAAAAPTKITRSNSHPNDGHIVCIPEVYVLSQLVSNQDPFSHEFVESLTHFFVLARWISYRNSYSSYEQKMCNGCSPESLLHHSNGHRMLAYVCWRLFLLPTINYFSRLIRYEHRLANKSFRCNKKYSTNL